MVPFSDIDTTTPMMSFNGFPWLLRKSRSHADRQRRYLSLLGLVEENIGCLCVECGTRMEGDVEGHSNRNFDDGFHSDYSDHDDDSVHSDTSSTDSGYSADCSNDADFAQEIFRGNGNLTRDHHSKQNYSAAVERAVANNATTGTSTRKPRLNSALVAQQSATLPGASGVTNGTNNNNNKSSATNQSSSSKLSSRFKHKHKKYPARLKNIDRSSGQTREVTVNSVTVFITEYKAKPVSTRRESSEQSYSESNDSRS